MYYLFMLYVFIKKNSRGEFDTAKRNYEGCIETISLFQWISRSFAFTVLNTKINIYYLSCVLFTNLKINVF